MIRWVEKKTDFESPLLQSNKIIKLQMKTQKHQVQERVHGGMILCCHLKSEWFFFTSQWVQWRHAWVKHVIPIDPLFSSQNGWFDMVWDPKSGPPQMWADPINWQLYKVLPLGWCVWKYGKYSQIWWWTPFPRKMAIHWGEKPNFQTDPVLSQC